MTVQDSRFDSNAEPLAGLRVVEVALGTSVVGAGMAASLPGAILRDLGAEVARVQHAQRSTLDAGVEFARVWDRGKVLVEVADDAPAVVSKLASEADVLLVCGPEAEIEQQGLGYEALHRRNPRLVYVRVRPSLDARGGMPDLELLVAARAGVLTQIRHHQPGRPVFPELAIAQAGAALSATAGALAKLYEREGTGSGGWVETSLYDGLLAMLPMIVGRAEHDSSQTTLLWRNQGPAAGLAYPCADGLYLQLWFGVPGAYEAFLARMGDEPTQKGYAADLASGALAARSERWAAKLATRERAFWLHDFSGAKFRCEPILRPGEALLDSHARELGLSIEHQDPERGRIGVLGPVARVTSRGGRHITSPGGALLEGVRVLDLSAYLAGPIGTLVLAELGADVVKVEPITGDLHRGIEPMYAAGQRGKRTLALDLKSAHAGAVLARLYAWSDVVHHNSRVGLAEKLGYDEASVRAANAAVVYSFASGFGETGPRALLAANDHLMQALCGIEASQGGFGQPPTVLMWGAMDVAGGWVSACGMIAGLYARRRSGAGQSVASSLYGAAMLLKSGAFVAADGVVSGPVLDPQQNGYGAAYRIYCCADGAWLALAVPDAAAWARLRVLVDPDLPVAPPPLRTSGGEPQPAERLLEAAFRTRSASVWLELLRRERVPAERVAELDRTNFSRGFLDDPINQQLGRVTHYTLGERGRVDQPTLPPRVGPRPRAGAHASIAALGEHTAEVLEAVGIDAAARAELVAAGAIRG
jgi:crotonobetainyl-CoA:carnitine CoA-transferase CaiB-like acyl-CoA transferase